MEILNVDTISVGYGSRNILKDFSISIKKGEFVSIIGPNGTGKSTFVKAISGELKYDKGEIYLNNCLIEKFSSMQRAKLFAVVTQFHNIQVSFRVEEFIMMARFPYQGLFHIPSQEDIIAVNESIVIAGIENLKNRKMNELSGGELQLVYIAHAITQSREFIVLDEPVNHLDISNSVKVMQLLKKLNSMGSTIVTVMHDVNLAANWSTRIVGIKNGEKIFDNDVSTSLNELNLLKLYDLKCCVKIIDGYYNIFPKIN